MGGGIENGAGKCLSNLMRKLLFLPIALASLTTISSAQTITQNFGSGANAFSMDFVTIGNPNNTANTLNNPYGLSGTQLNAQAGSVGYTYAISKYEVSRDMVLKVNAEGTTALGELADMTKYGFGLPTMPSSEMNGLNRPATGLTWFGAARFVNWLNISQGFAPAYKLSITPPPQGELSSDTIGLWTPTEAGYNPNNLFRNSQAHYFLPSLDEWHKAAFYNSTTGTYSLYATASNDLPTKTLGGTTQGTAVRDTPIFGWAGVNADVDNAGGLSAYGTMGQAGNVLEWIETAKDFVNNDGAERRLFLGGSFYTDQGLRNDQLLDSEPIGSNSVLGFRIASVPEPSSLSLLVLGGAVVALCRRKRA